MMSFRILGVGLVCVSYTLLVVYLARHPRCPEWCDPSLWKVLLKAQRRARRRSA